MVAKGEIVEDSSRNLLQRFVGRMSVDAASPDVPTGGGSTCEVELGLGLSLNGCFGVEPKGKRLIRSSSISSLSIFPSEHNAPLTRTCSLPEETEVERRKRKEVESLKRMEAKRKRSEKKAVAVNGEVGRWVTGKGVNGVSRIASLGSIGSQGSSSSSISDLESKPDIASTAANIAGEGDEPSKKKKKSCGSRGGMRESERSMMEEMPSVSTKGDGPDGRRIEGFLYKYQKGEVRIVCVCHGQFLTPAEFVRHARGGDVAHPLRHIVVNRTPALL